MLGVYILFVGYLAFSLICFFVFQCFLGAANFTEKDLMGFSFLFFSFFYCSNLRFFFIYLVIFFFVSFFVFFFLFNCLSKKGEKFHQDVMTFVHVLRTPIHYVVLLLENLFLDSIIQMAKRKDFLIANDRHLFLCLSWILESVV